MMNKKNQAVYVRLFIVAIIVFLFIAPMFLQPRYAWVCLAVVGGILVVSYAVYYKVSKPAGLKVAHPDAADAARVAKQLIEILFFDPDSYINMPDWYHFMKGLHWLAYPEGRGVKPLVVNPKIDPAGLKGAHPDAADAVRVAKQLIKILSIHLHTNMPDRYLFIKGLFWLAYPEGRGIKPPVVNPKIDPVGIPKSDPAGLKFVYPDTADAPPVAKELIKILLFHPHMNMPGRDQFIKGLFWLAYPEGRGIKPPVVNPKIDPAGLKFVYPNAANAPPVAKELIKILLFHPHINMPGRDQFIKGLFWLAFPKFPVVSPKIDPVVNPRIELDSVVVNPRIESDAVVVKPGIEPVEVAEDGNLSIQHV